MAWARKKDGPHAAIVAELVKHGWVCEETWRAPKCADLFAAKGYRVIRLEVKAKGGKLSDDQRTAFEQWPGEKYVISHPAEVELIDRAVESTYRPVKLPWSCPTCCGGWFERCTDGIPHYSTRGLA